MKPGQSSKSTGRDITKAWSLLGEDFKYEVDRYVPESKAKKWSGKTSQDNDVMSEQHACDGEISESREEKAARNFLAIAPNNNILESISLADTHPVSK